MAGGEGTARATLVYDVYSVSDGQFFITERSTVRFLAIFGPKAGFFFFVRVFSIRGANDRPSPPLINVFDRYRRTIYSAAIGGRKDGTDGEKLN